MNTLSLGEKIKLLRKKNGITQKELAKAIPTSFSTFRRWEKNNHAPDIKDISRLAEILHTTVSYLSGEEDEKTITTITSNTKEQSLKIDRGMMVYHFNNGESIELPAMPDLIPVFKQMIKERAEEINKI